MLFKKFCKIISVIVSACIVLNIPYLMSFAESDGAEQPAQATSLVLADANSGKILSSANGAIQMPTGTLTKIMTALLVAESIESGGTSLDTLVTASSAAQSAGGAVIWLTAGEKMSVSDLLLSMMTGNANDAAIALAEHIGGTQERFVEKMNERAKSLGMKNTAYVNCTGLDAEGGFSTAEDIAKLCAELVKHEFLYEFMTPWLTYIRDGATELVNFNDLVKSFDGLIGIKASKTENSGICLAAAAKRGSECYIAVCLGFSDKDECLNSGKSLLKSGFSSYSTVYPIIDATALHNITVKGGTVQSVGVDVKITPICIPCSDETLVSSAVVLPEYINAPVEKGQKLGTLFIYADDVLICELDITAQNGAEKQSMKHAFRSLLESLLK